MFDKENYLCPDFDRPNPGAAQGIAQQQIFQLLPVQQTIPRRDVRINGMRPDNAEDE
jgi:hypothetical protein